MYLVHNTVFTLFMILKTSSVQAVGVQVSGTLCRTSLGLHLSATGDPEKGLQLHCPISSCIKWAVIDLTELSWRTEEKLHTKMVNQCQCLSLPCLNIMQISKNLKNSNVHQLDQIKTRKCYELQLKLALNPFLREWFSLIIPKQAYTTTLYILTWY